MPATKVEGCASQVWLVPEVEGTGRDARLSFRGDSDAMIVRGLIAILIALYGGLTPREVLAVDAPAELGRLGLEDHLSSQRSNGLRAMVQPDPRARRLGRSGGLESKILSRRLTADAFCMHLSILPEVLNLSTRR